MLRHKVYWVTMPLRIRARRTPKTFPEVTIERAIARLCGGARAPTRGSIICGGTVVMAGKEEKGENNRKRLGGPKPNHGGVVLRDRARNGAGDARPPTQ